MQWWVDCVGGTKQVHIKVYYEIKYRICSLVWAGSFPLSLSDGTLGLPPWTKTKRYFERHKLKDQEQQRTESMHIFLRSGLELSGPVLFVLWFQLPAQVN